MVSHILFWPLKADSDVHIEKTLLSKYILRAFTFDMKNNSEMVYLSYFCSTYIKPQHYHICSTLILPLFGLFSTRNIRGIPLRNKCVIIPATVALPVK